MTLNRRLPDGAADPDVYVLELPHSMYSEANSSIKKLSIEFTPEQAEEFEEFVAERFGKEGVGRSDE